MTLNPARHNHLFEHIPGERYRLEFLRAKVKRIPDLVRQDEWRTEFLKTSYKYGLKK